MQANTDGGDGLGRAPPLLKNGGNDEGDHGTPLEEPSSPTTTEVVSPMQLKSSDVDKPAGIGEGIGRAGEEQMALEYVEEFAYGRIIQGEDGQFYVVMDKGSPSIELDKLNNVQVVVNEDGSESLLLTQGQDDSLPSRLNIKDSSLRPGAEATSVSGGTVVARRIGGGLFPPPLGRQERDEDVESSVEGEEELLIGAQFNDGSEQALSSKQRRSRVYGACRCPECHQTFVNTARLERHLAVHQIFGSYLCPLCGKTYKYEYNLFYHWRKTCRDMNDLLSKEERKDMEVNNLRSLVEEVAQKKSLIGPLDLGISGQQLYRGGGASSSLDKYETYSRSRASTCKDCGVTIHEGHMARHLAVHLGEVAVDERSFAGGYFCDLCGLMFRQHQNLIRHWRTACPEIQANLPEGCDIALDDAGLKQMVYEILRKSVAEESSAGEPSTSADTVQRKGQVPPLKKAMVVQEVDDHIDVVSPGEEEFFNERLAEEQGIIFADDLADETETTHLVINEEGRLCTVEKGDRSTARPLPPTTLYPTQEAYPAEVSLGMQTVQSVGAVQCPECFKPFSTVARLERHLAGAHCAYGTHHCVLCGNRFKYDYNLLYHYRRSCAYTKALIDQDTREQLDATGLKKLVRKLATKEHLLPNSGRDALLNIPPSGITHRQELGDSVVRKQMLHAVMPPSLRQQSSQQQVPIQVPQHVQLHPSRPGMPEGLQCPICSIVFYGSAVLDRHMKVAHPYEYQSRYEIDDQELSGHVETVEGGISDASPTEQLQAEMEPPPTLQPEADQTDNVPGTSAGVAPPPMRYRAI